jgi:hypothetical protein
MRFASRTAAIVLLLLATVSCLEEDERPCNGCTSPHPYTETSGGTTGELTGSAIVTHEHGSVTYACDRSGNCSWVGAMIKITATVPDAWVVPDAGEDGEADADADAGAEAEAEAEADAEVPDAATGVPRGWSTTATVVLVELGETPLEDSFARLAGARVVTCPSRHEAIVAGEDGSYYCQSATRRPARVEALEGKVRFSRSGGSERSSTARSLEGTTDSGDRVSFNASTTTTPVRSYTVQNCY